MALPFSYTVLTLLQASFLLLLLQAATLPPLPFFSPLLPFVIIIEDPPLSSTTPHQVL